MSFANVNDVLRRIKKEEKVTQILLSSNKRKKRDPPPKKKTTPKPQEVEDGAGEQRGHISKSTISTWGE